MPRTRARKRRPPMDAGRLSSPFTGSSSIHTRRSRSRSRSPSTLKVVEPCHPSTDRYIPQYPEYRSRSRSPYPAADASNAERSSWADRVLQKKPANVPWAERIAKLNRDLVVRRREDEKRARLSPVKSTPTKPAQAHSVVVPVFGPIPNPPKYTPSKPAQSDNATFPNSTPINSTPPKPAQLDTIVKASHNAAPGTTASTTFGSTSASATPTRTTLPRQVTNPNHNSPIRVARRDDPLASYGAFFASSGGRPRFSAMLRQPNAWEAFVGRGEKPYTKSLEVYFPRLRFRAQGGQREGVVCVWAELPSRTRKDGFVLSRFDRQMLEAAGQLLETYAALRTDKLPNLTDFIPAYFEGKYD